MTWTDHERLMRLADEEIAARRVRLIVTDLCEALGIELTLERRAAMVGVDVAWLQKLRAHLKQHRAWPGPRGGRATIASMSSDELLSEACDPETPPDRLEELRLWTRQFPTKQGQREVQFAVHHALLGNPNLPLELLHEPMTRRRPDRGMLAAWFNPSVALLLVSHPLPAFEDAANRLLCWVQCGGGMQGMQDQLTLAARIAPWAEGREDEATWTVAPGALTPAQRDEVRRVAARLAGLFGLPWPGQREGRAKECPMGESIGVPPWGSGR